MKLEMKNPTHSFRKMNRALQLLQKFGVKSKTVTSWGLQKKKKFILCNVYFLQIKLFDMCVVSIYKVLTKLSE